MAELDFLKKLDGNGYLMEAAKMLAMVPEWHEKPGKLKAGIAEQCVRIARYLVKAYVQAEGLPDKAKFDLVEQIAPRAQEMRAAVEAGREERGAVSPAGIGGAPAAGGEVPMPDAGYREFVASLNEWHLELACAVDGLRYLVQQVDYDPSDPLGGVAHIVTNRAQQLVEACPFPKT